MKIEVRTNTHTVEYIDEEGTALQTEKKNLHEKVVLESKCAVHQVETLEEIRSLFSFLLPTHRP